MVILWVVLKKTTKIGVVILIHYLIHKKKIRLRMIDEFNKNLDIRSGRKFDKVVSNGSVWGFVIKTNGKLKGIPYFVGDVFKPAGWSAPAKHVRGSIFSSKSNWYSWTGPNYLV